MARDVTSKARRLVLKPKAFSVYKDRTRFRVISAGRRWGKSFASAAELLKFATKKPNSVCWYIAPTYKMARRILWTLIKSSVPPEWIRYKNESDLMVILKNGSSISLCGAENYDGLRGSGIDFVVLDEFAFMSMAAWNEVIRAALSDRKGHAMFISSPAGLNHFYDFAQKEIKLEGKSWKTWQFTTLDGGWVDASEIEEARRELDTRTFEQEYLGKFLNFAGRVAYEFEKDNYIHELEYNPNKPLLTCWDFNNAPGVCAIGQDQIMPGQFDIIKTATETIKAPVIGTGIIGEVWIPQHSNTLLVCKKLYQDWGDHKGDIIFYGDPAGGQKKSSGVQGTDWELIENFFKQTPWCDRMTFDIPRAHPSVRSRINATNSRIRSIDGIIRFMVDAVAAPHVVDDFERLTTLEGTAGEIDKKSNPMIGHIYDAVSYMLAQRFPIFDGHAATVIDL